MHIRNAIVMLGGDSKLELELGLLIREEDGLYYNMAFVRSRLSLRHGWCSAVFVFFPLHFTSMSVISRE